jgi:hypothetical protein
VLPSTQHNELANLHSTSRSLNLNLVPPPPPVVPISTNRDREAQLSRRVKELEEELRTMRVENEKQVSIVLESFNFPAEIKAAL